MKQFDTRKMMKAVAGGGMKMPKMPGRNDAAIGYILQDFIARLSFRGAFY